MLNLRRLATVESTALGEVAPNVLLNLSALVARSGRRLAMRTVRRRCNTASVPSSAGLNSTSCSRESMSASTGSSKR